jgi:hypothetical protein
MFQRIACSLLLMLLAVGAYAQATSINGIVVDEKEKPLEFVTVGIEGTTIGASTDARGSYTLNNVPADRDIVVVFTYIGYIKQKLPVRVAQGTTKGISITLKKEATTLDEVVKTEERGREQVGMVQIDANKAKDMVGTNFGSGIETIVKTMTGTNNELTSQYNVRGGNYDENLVYVNDFEIYRPFLTRSGQQEGMSFINSDLVSNVNFSVGGFQARYGDKMSSVLDVNYKRPTGFSGRATLSLLGAGLSLQGASKNEKFIYLVGARHKSNQYLLQAQPTKGVYNPSFTDVQALLGYRFNGKWEMEVIANYARNRFNFFPEKATSSFGLVNKAFQMTVAYKGSEIDQFDSRFGGWSATYRPNEKLKLKLLASGFQTNEAETYDISGEYLFGELETDLGKNNFGQVKTYLGTGIIHNYARNYLEVNVGNIAHRGTYNAGKHFIHWGLDANTTTIADKLHEWERRDSAGYTQPALPYDLQMSKLFVSSSTFNYMRYSGYLQDNFRFSDSLGLTMSVGVRFNYSTLNEEMLVSPRAQIAYKPRWKNDMIFKLGGGLYQQPPFYREMRDLNGVVNKDLKAQKSYHIVAGTDYNFIAAKRPFKFTTEVYYKGLWDIVPYEYDNVRIRYFGQNNAIGYVYGGELRIYGDIVKDATSWISVGLMNAREDVTDDKIVYKGVSGADSATVEPGYIPRPTDQRFMLGMYFEDYFPKWKNFKMHLNLMYATGLPFGPPDNKRYGDTLRLPDYKRVDIGFSALLLKGEKHTDSKVMSAVKNMWFTAEIFNLLGIQNTLSYSWIQDQSSGGTFAVPNRLTSRLINVKLVVDF